MGNIIIIWGRENDANNFSTNTMEPVYIIFGLY